MKWTRSVASVGVTVTVASMIGIWLMSPAFADQSGASAAQPAGSSTSTVVTTTSGAVRGLRATGYDQWLGIPYAADPAGQKRWTAPKPVTSWSGVRDATKFSDRCAQNSGWDPGYEKVTSTENCLALNVYVPHGAQGRLPVLTWIHGGGFTGGAGQDTDPRKFVQQGKAIVVTINYRLGALGFLDLPQLEQENPQGPGNYGLLDQQVALRWVHDNSARFGGDPSRVTIAGQSAGGSSVCDQLASPSAKGLFSGAIIMSGGCSMTSVADGRAASARFVQAAGCSTAADALACLRGKSAAELLTAQQTAGVRPSLGGTAFPTDPATVVPAGKFNRVPVLLGQVDNERALFTFQNYDYLGKPLTAAQYEALVTSTYGTKASKVLAEYPASSFPSADEAWTAVQNDQTAAVRQGLFRSLSKYVPTYAYEFAENDTPQFASIYLIQQKSEAARAFPFRATHVDDLGYLWEYLGQTLPYTDDELELSNQMISYWSGFVRTGNPNGDFTPSWPAYRSATDTLMSLVACKTSPATGQPPAACSALSTQFSTEHNTAFWNALT